MPADKPRNVSLTVHGHLWREQPNDPLSREIPLQGGISVGNRFDMELKDGASCPGDYLYRSGSFGWDVEYGMWGIFRVMKHSIRCKCKEMCGRLLRCMKWKSKTCLQSLVHSIPICYSEHRNNNSRSRWRIKIQEELMTWKFKKKWESQCWRQNIWM